MRTAVEKTHFRPCLPRFPETATKTPYGLMAIRAVPGLEQGFVDETRATVYAVAFRRWTIASPFVL